jgi:hypothetical protein
VTERRYRGRPWRGSNQGNTKNEKSLCHQSSIDFRCYLELARFEPRPNPFRELLKGECPPLVRASYQREGERLRPASLVFDPSMVPDLRAWLTARLGPLAACEPTGQGKPAALPPRPPAPEPAMPAPPPAAPARPQLPPEVPSPEQVARLRDLSARLETARPPRLGGDVVRLMAWRERQAALTQREAVQSRRL